jgi:methionyl-tRNA formyltransferase
MLQKHGVGRTLNKLALNWVRSRLVGSEDEKVTRERLFDAAAPVVYQRDVPRVIVSNINDAETVRFVRAHMPDVIAVCGTTVIKPEIFTLAPLGAVNIHTGITPNYRSADPIFWAIYHNEPDQVGVTIHFVDKGIDTGTIIYQEQVPLYREDSLARIYTRCISTGARLYVRALDDIAAGSVRVRDRSDVLGRAFYSINQGLLQYAIFLWRFRRLRRRLPSELTAPDAAAEPGP